MRSRPGYVLLTVLWVVAAVAVIEGLALSAGRQMITASRNRLAWRQGAFLAEQCSADVRAAVDAVLQQRGDTAWRWLDEMLPPGSDAGCRVKLVPEGMTLNANSADEFQLSQVIVSLGIPLATADSLAAAISDWTDDDNIARAGGAESDWYRSAHRVSPRNGALRSIEELSLIRGVSEVADLSSVVGVLPAPIVLERAPMAVIRVLPGIDDESAMLLDEWRRLRRRFDLVGLATALSPESRNNLTARFGELTALTAPVAQRWIVDIQTTVGSPSIESRLRFSLSRSGHGVQIAKYWGTP